MHLPETAAVSNIERKILKLMGGELNKPLGVYCEQDANNHYHVWQRMPKCRMPSKTGAPFFE
ncbi:MAG: hypothetical protein R2825_09295 [Saprospiraceae bacterium]